MGTFFISTRNNDVASRKTAYPERCVTALCGHLSFFLGDGKESTLYFPFLESGSSFEGLGGRRTLEQKASRWQCLHKTISHLMPWALRGSKKFRSPRNVQVAPDLQTFSHTVAASHARAWNLFSPCPQSCPSLLPPYLLLVQQPGSLCGLWLGVTLSLTNCCVSSAESAGLASVGSSGPQTWWHSGIAGAL